MVTECPPAAQNKSPVRTIIKKDDLIIIVPQTKSKRIKLNRNNVTLSVSNQNVIPTKIAESTSNVTKNVNPEVPKDLNAQTVVEIVPERKRKTEVMKETDKPKKRSKEKKKKLKKKDGECSDHDEIMLQLSDSEKMDLLEDFDRKNYDMVSSSETSDSDSSSDDHAEKSPVKQESNIKSNEDDSQTTEMQNKPETAKTISDEVHVNDSNNSKDNTDVIEKVKITESTSNCPIVAMETVANEVVALSENVDKDVEDTNADKLIEICNIEDIPIIENDREGKETDVVKITEEVNKTDESMIKNIVIGSSTQDTDTDKRKVDIEYEVTADKIIADSVTLSKQVAEESIILDVDNTAINKRDLDEEAEVTTDKSKLVTDEVTEDSKDKDNEITVHANEDKSEGELTDKSSSDVEAFDIRTEVVCISDEDNEGSHKKKKKKGKKSKKEKKSKKQKKSDFREASDQNFYKDDKLENTNAINSVDNNLADNKSKINSMAFLDVDSSESSPIYYIDSDNVYEVLEISDDSSCYEVEGISVLSKEPTSEEIEALSEKIRHEIEREEVITEEEIRAHERMEKEREIAANSEELENISWKDRYLGSKKVKKVLTTSNILNALRKKNKELKRKLDENKKKNVNIEEKVNDELETKQNEVVEDGTIDQYNNLEGSTKYVDPVIEKALEMERVNEEKDLNTEMTKDAKQLLKMYKRLLKYNSIKKPRDPNKPKKNKKQKRKKDGVGVSIS